MAEVISQPVARFVVGPGNVRLHYLEWPGTGPLLLLLHGLGGRCTGWSEVAGALQNHFHVVAPDYRGHGLSDKPDGPYDTEAYLADLEALLAQLQPRQFYVAGHSLGGLLALYLAARHPEQVKRIVVEDSHPGAIPGSAALRAQKLDMYPVPFPSRAEAISFIRELRGEASARWYGLSLQEQPDGWGWAFSVRAVIATERLIIEADHWPVVGQVTCPALVLFGARSPFITPIMAIELAGRLPNARTAAIADAGHWLHGEQPEAYVNAVLPFLRAGL